MFILENVIGTCSDPALASILLIIKKFMNILWIIGPILAMIGAVIALVKMMSNPEEKKHKNLLRNMIISLLLLFFIPTIVNTVMKLFDDSFTISACWNYAEQYSGNNQGSNYIEDENDKSGSSILIDPDDYETGEPTDTGSPSNNTSSSSSGSTISSSKVIFVGDSRTVGMKQSVGDVGENDVWSCKSSMGLDWMKSTGIPNIDSQVTSGTSLVILMGVNDLYHVNSYITYLNGLVPSVTNRGAKLYFVSVNPTSRSSDYLNESIDNFNTKMKSGLSSYIKYIDTNSYLKADGFSSEDGVHYSATTYNKIYTYIKNNL